MKKLLMIGAMGPNVNDDIEKEGPIIIFKNEKDTNERRPKRTSIEIPSFMSEKRNIPRTNLALSIKDKAKLKWKCIRELDTLIGDILDMESEPEYLEINIKVMDPKTGVRINHRKVCKAR